MSVNFIAAVAARTCIFDNASDNLYAVKRAVEDVNQEHSVESSKHSSEDSLVDTYIKKCLELHTLLESGEEFDNALPIELMLEGVALAITLNSAAAEKRSAISGDLTKLESCLYVPSLFTRKNLQAHITMLSLRNGGTEMEGPVNVDTDLTTQTVEEFLQN